MTLAQIALTAVHTNDFGQFGIALQREEDPLRILWSPELSPTISAELGSNSPGEWLLRERTWSPASYGPHLNLKPSETLLHLLWQDLTTRLNSKLQSAFQQLTLPSKGAILCFIDGVAFSLIVAYYRARTGALRLRPIATSDRPLGVFELSQLLATSSPGQRNDIKAVALSVDKFLFQRGVLNHVDRQKEDVFGPSIDTVLMCEALASWLAQREPGSAITALEVGPGNGLLCTLLASSEKVERLYAVDLNPAAVICTLKNLEINGARLDSKKPEIYVRAERFRAEFPEKIDLIVCNPPYIPKSPKAGMEKGSGYELAIEGLELSECLLGALEALLSANGSLLLMTSSVSLTEIQNMIPTGFTATPLLEGRGLRVPLDVDVLWQSREWQEHLVANGRIETDAEGGLWHYIQPLWISRAGGSPSES